MRIPFLPRPDLDKRLMLLRPDLALCVVRFFVALGLCLVGTALQAGSADVIAAKASQSRNGSWRVEATIRHADTGWDHYANGFEVLTADGNLLATRVLHHPHVKEQPFTRSVSVDIPTDVKQIIVRAQDSTHGQGGAFVTIELY